MQARDVFDQPLWGLGERVVVDGGDAVGARDVVGAVAAAPKGAVDGLLSADRVEFVVESLDVGVDRSQFGWCGVLGQPAEFAEARGESSEWVGVGLCLRDLGECSFLAPVGRHGGVGERLEESVYFDRSPGGPLSGCRQRGDQLVDLLEFDEVGPVGDDPLASVVLGGGGGEEVLVEFGRVDGRVGQSLDELGLVWRCGGSGGVEFPAAVAKFVGCALS